MLEVEIILFSFAFNRGNILQRTKKKLNSQKTSKLPETCHGDKWGTHFVCKAPAFVLSIHSKQDDHIRQLKTLLQM